MACAFQSLLINEFHNRDFGCSQIVPPFSSLIADSQVCSAAGSQPGVVIAQGDAYINASCQYYAARNWHNFGITLGFMDFFMVVRLVITQRSTT